MTFDNNVQAIAKEALLPSAVDIVHNSNVLTMRVLNKAKIGSWRGTKIERSIITEEAGNGGSFSGLDRFNTNTSNTKQKLSFDVRGYEQPVAIPQMEVDAVQSSPNKSVEYITEAMEEAANEMADNLAALFYGDGTGNSNKDFLGLAAIVDDGGEVATYGGLSRSTYSDLQASETDVGGALTLGVMATSFSAVERGKERPTLIITTKSIWNDFEALHQPTQVGNTNFENRFGSVTQGQVLRPGQGLQGDSGFVALFYRGVPVVSDDQATSGSLWMLNEKWLEFYRLPTTKAGFTSIAAGGNTQIDGQYEQPSGMAGFDWSGFIDPVDQHGSVGHFILQGQFLSWSPRNHAVLNTIS